MGQPLRDKRVADHGVERMDVLCRQIAALWVIVFVQVVSDVLRVQTSFGCKLLAGHEVNATQLPCKAHSLPIRLGAGYTLLRRNAWTVEAAK